MTDGRLLTLPMRTIGAPPRNGSHVRAGRAGELEAAASDCRPNGSDVKLQAAHTRERTSGAPLAAMHTVLTLSVCKRRDAVRLALNEPAPPAGAVFGGLSASAASWAVPISEDRHRDVYATVRQPEFGLDS